MFTRKNFKVRSLIQFTGAHLLILTIWTIIVVSLYDLTHWEWMTIPWLPLSVIGTAVAFYVGFKNNSAYDRLWEARKIWGAIVNSSRSLATMTKWFISNAENDDVSKAELDKHIKKVYYRHIAWLYTLRSQLLIPTPWEHINQGRIIKKATEKRRRKSGVNLFDDEASRFHMQKYLKKEEYERVIPFNNTATHIIDKQTKHFAKLNDAGLLNDFRHMEIQKVLSDLYGHQGKCERIKKFPLPRQYGGMSLVFVYIFTFLLPLGMVSEFDQLGPHGSLLSIPFTVLVGWVYICMELIGDYSENPFEGLGNDVPMLSLCRTIEIDMLQMIDQKDIPDPIKAKNHILM